jgi:catecholate siderophore receptor
VIRTARALGGKRKALCLKGLVVVLLAGLWGVGAHADEPPAHQPEAHQSPRQTYQFDIPAGPLSAALSAFQMVTGLKVTVDAALGQNLSSPGVVGVFTPAQALDHLSIGTGLTARQTALDTFSLEVWISPESVEVTATSTPYRAEGSATATKTLTPLRDIPQTLNVISRELLVDQGAQSVAAAMKNVPGVSIAQGEGNRDQIVLRGISTATDFFVNGIRDDQERFRDLYNVETLEVVHGPAAVLFGRGGGGGVVNLVTRSPLSGGASEAVLELGRYDHKRGSFQFEQQLSNRSGFRVSAMGEDSGGFRDGYFLHRYGVNPSFGAALGDSTTLTVAYEHLYDRRLADRGIPSQAGKPVDVNPSQFFGSTAQSFARSGVDSGTATVEHRFNRNLLFRNNFLVGRYDKFYQNVYAGSSVNASGTLTLAAYNHGIDRTNAFNQSDFIYNGRIARMEHTILFGVEMGHQLQDETRYTAANISNVPVDSSRRDADFLTATLAVDRDATSSVLAGYLQDQVALTRRWKAVLGLRRDRFTVKINDHRAGAPDLSRSDAETSPRAGVIYQPADTASIYASYSYTFLPSGQNLGLAVNTAELKPENAKNYEVGAKLDLLEKRLNLSAAIFRLDRNNVKNTDPTNPQLLVLTGQQRTDGLSIASAGRLTSRWKVHAGYAYLNARIVRDTASAPAGRKVGLVPASQATLWTTYELSKRWEVGGGTVSQSRQFTSFSNAVELPGFTRVDAAAYYRLGRYRLALNSENVLNARFYPTAHNDNNISPASPRSLQLSLRVIF